MDQNSVGFMHLKNKFPRIIDAKIKEGVFVGPHIGELINEVKFADQLTEVEKIRVEIIQKSLFFFNYKAENYRDMVADLVQSHKAMGCNMSLKRHF